MQLLQLITKMLPIFSLLFFFYIQLLISQVVEDTLPRQFLSTSSTISSIHVLLEEPQFLRHPGV